MLQFANYAPKTERRARILLFPFRRTENQTNRRQNAPLHPSILLKTIECTSSLEGPSSYADEHLLLTPPSPIRRHHSPARLALDLAPPIALVGRQQDHLLALLHGRFALATRIVRVKSLDVADLLAPRRGATAGPCLRPALELMLPARDVVDIEAAVETGRSSVKEALGVISV